MFSISRILAPIDFSERCLGILPYARTIGSRYDAELTLLHVVNPVYSIPAAGPFGPAVVSIPPSVFEDATRKLDGFGTDHLQGSRVRRSVYEGDPAEQILAFAKSENTDLIIMPTHGLGVLRRFLIGSITAKVLHDAACPVLTDVHVEPAPRSNSVSFSKILCAVDLGPSSGRALAWAAQFRNDFGARLAVVHAITSHKRGSEWEEMEALQQAAEVNSAEICIREGEPAKTVCSVASSIGADLLVIGRAVPEHSTDRLRSTAYAIISRSSCPVVSV
jgi:nucleotide-binding universal stress UspA family protein